MKYEFNKWVFLLLIALLNVCAYSSDIANESRVLIILKGSDSNNVEIGNAFNEQANQAKNLYGSLGFRIIQLSDDNKTLTSDKILSTLSNLKSVKEIHLMLLEHGIVNKDKEFNLQTNNGQSTISGASIKEAILNAIKNNPDVKVYVPGMSCYGGALGNELADVQGVLTLPETGNNRPTIVDAETKFNPNKIFLDSLSKHQDYFSAEQSTWQAQFDYYTIPKSAFEIVAISGDTSLPIPLQEFPLLRTQAELFLENWCTAKNNSSLSLSKSLCTQGNLSSAKEIPNEMKELLLQEYKNTNQTKMVQIKNLSDKVGCNSIISTNPSATEFNLIRNKTIIKFLKQLTLAMDNITPEEFAKNSKAYMENPLLSMLELAGLSKKDLENKMKTQEPELLPDLDFEKTYPNRIIKTFKDNCLLADFDPLKELVIDEGETTKTTCGEYFTSNISYIVQNFSPQTLTNPKPSDLKLVPSNKLPLRESFKELTDQLNQQLNNEANNHKLYFDDTSNLVSLKLPTPDDYCRLVIGSLAEYQKDINCMQSFKESATGDEWLRLLDISNLSHRTLFKEGSK